MYILWGVHGVNFVAHTFMYSPKDKKKDDSLVTDENDDDFIKQHDE